MTWKTTVAGARVQAAAEQRGALAHAEDPVAGRAGIAGAVAGRRIGDRQLELALAVGDPHGDWPGAVPGGVGQGLLQDPVGRLVRAGSQRSRGPVDLHVERHPGGVMALEQRRHRGQPGRRLDRIGRLIAVIGRAQAVNQLVDLLDRLARDLLDRGQRRADRAGIAVLQQARATGLHEDHVDRVRGGVVQVPRDPIALLGHREPTLARGLALGPLGALTQVSQPLPALAQLVPDDPRPTPHDDRAEDRRPWETPTWWPRPHRRGSRPAPPRSPRSGASARASAGRRPGRTGRPSVRTGGRARSRGSSIAALATVHTTNTSRGQRRCASSGRQAIAASPTPSASRVRVAPDPCASMASVSAERDRRDRGVARHCRPSASDAPGRGGGSAGDAHVRTSVTRDRCSSSPPQEGSCGPPAGGREFPLWGVSGDAAARSLASMTSARTATELLEGTLEERWEVLDGILQRKLDGQWRPADRRGRAGPRRARSRSATVARRS